MTNLKPDFHVPRRASSIGVWLFLAALAMLFIASLLMYILLRIQVFGGERSGRIDLPSAAWLSTAVLIMGSFTIHQAVSSVRREKLLQLKQFLIATAVLAIVFLIVQTPCLLEILHTHDRLQAQFVAAHAQDNGRAQISASFPLMYGMVFCLILLHALHVVGGIVGVIVVTVRAQLNKYDHENFHGVRSIALYWHFLDLVWLAMFGTFLALG